MASSDHEPAPRALTDFVFDLYDSVTMSQIEEEQTKLYQTDFRDLSSKYFANQPWPSPQSIASECNGHPLFLSVYRELTHRHWHAVSRPNIRDRMEGWQIYSDLFEEILSQDDTNFFLLPDWTFDIIHEFVYQFQGFCQIRSAVYAAARKHGLLPADGGTAPVAATSASQQHSNLAENLSILQSSTDEWDVEAVFSYLHRLVKMGFPQDAQATATNIQPVYSYFSIFASVGLSRLECLLGDYTASLQAMTPISVFEDYVIPKDEGATVLATLQSVFPARLSAAYHTGVSFLMLRRYKDAAKVLGNICVYMQRGFKTGQLRKLAGSEQFTKQYDRMLSLQAILTQVCPSHGLPDSVLRAIREKFGSKLETASSYEEWFACPKFVSSDPSNNVYRQQVATFLKEMESQPACKKMRSYLKLYSSLPVEKLAKFYDLDTEDFLPVLLSFKTRMRQLERSEGDNYIEGSWKTALDIHFYLEGDKVHIDEAEKQRRFENYFVTQIAQNADIRLDVEAISTNV